MSVSDESGFDAGDAYVTVSPDAADFAQALDEELGGLQVAVRVVPDSSDFQGLIDEDDLTADVRLIPNVAGFEDRVDEAVSGMSATVSVGADTSPLRSGVHGALDEVNSARGDVTIGADVSGLGSQAEAAIADQLSALSGSVSVGVDAGGDASGVERLTGDLDQLTSAAGQAQSALGGVEGGVSALESIAQSAAAGLGAVLGGHLGGVVPVVVVPDMAEFDSRLAEGTEGAEARVTLIPDVADFADRVGDETAGLTAPVLLVPDAADFQDRVDEETSGLTATVSVGAGMGGAGGAAGDFASSVVPQLGAIEEAADDAGRAVTVSAETFDRYLAGRAAAQAGIDALNGVSQAANEAKATIEDDFGSMEAEASRLGDALREVDAQFLSMANAQFGPATDAELSDLTARFENLYEHIGDVQGQLTQLRGEFDAAGGDFAGLDQGFGGVADSLRTFDENLAGTEEVLRTVAGDFFDLQEQAARMGVSVDELGPKMDEFFAGYVARADAARASLIALNGEAGMMGSKVADGAAEAGEAAGGLGGVFGELAGRLSYMAVDPFLWMMAVPMLISPIEEGIRDLGALMNPVSGQAAELGQKMAEQAQQVNYNSGSWEKLAQTQREYGKVSGGLVGDLMGKVAQESSASADSLGQHMTSLGEKYHLTQGQVAQLAKAAGVSAKQLSASGRAGDEAKAKIEAYANANLSAQGPVSELAGDLMTFGNNTLTAAAHITAFDDAFGLLVGNFAGVQQAQLTTAQGFITLKADADVAGASMAGTGQDSLTLQQQFYSQVTAIDTTVDAMEKQKDSTLEVNTYIQDQIDKLSGYAGDSASAQYAMGQLKTLEEGIGDAAQQTTQYQEQAANQLAGQFTQSVKNAGGASDTTTNYINGLKTSIEQTGTTSQQTANLRQELINSLEQAGVKASTATTMVDGFIKKLGQIPNNVNLNLTETAKGTWSESELLATGAANIPALPGAQKVITGNANVPGLAGGGLVRGGSGMPKADDIPSLLSDNEFVVQSDAVDHYGVGMMNAINARRFASGGLASGYSGSLPGLGQWDVNQYDATADALANALADSATSAGKSAQSAGGNAAALAGTALSGASGSVQAMAQKAAAALGWTGAQWAALDAVEMREAGWNLTARNPTSGAYGIAQFINGPSEYAQYGGNANTAAGQIAAFLAYIQQRYGNPEGAEAHEQQYGWYKNGGHMRPGETGWVGEAGPELMTAGPSGATVTPGGRGQNVVNLNFYGTQYPTNEQIANLKQEFAYALVAPP